MTAAVEGGVVRGVLDDGSDGVVCVEAVWRNKRTK